jgi:hypothetical protein
MSAAVENHAYASHVLICTQHTYIYTYGDIVAETHSTQRIKPFLCLKYPMPGECSANVFVYVDGSLLRKKEVFHENMSLSRAIEAQPPHIQWLCSKTARASGKESWTLAREKSSPSQTTR